MKLWKRIKLIKLHKKFAKAIKFRHAVIDRCSMCNGMLFVGSTHRCDSKKVAKYSVEKYIKENNLTRKQNENKS